MEYGDYEVTKILGRKNKNQYYELRCKICGHTKECGQSNLLRQDNTHSPRNCQYDYYKILIGNKFGDYICTNIIKTNRGYRAIMKCSVCGNITEKHANSDLTKIHDGFSCGKLYHEGLLGRIFGDLQIIELWEYKYHTMFYKCKCVKCGIESQQSLASIKRNIKHGTHCLQQIPDSPIKTAIIQRYNDMKQRCTNHNNSNFKHYGKRGIKLLYESSVDMYIDFAEELQKHSQKYGLQNSTFDRIDVNGNYEKHNLRITTQLVQNVNTTRKTIFIIQKGKEKILSDSSSACGKYLKVNGRAIGNLVRGQSKTSYGWTLYKIVEPNEDLEKVSIEEGVTTKLIVS